MRRKIMEILMGASAAACVLSGAAGAVSASENTAVAQTEVQSEEQSETQAAAVQTEAQTEKSDFVEGSALLSDYGYKEGEMNEDGWTSEFLNMKYVPAKSVSMAVEQTKKLEDEYYLRNGEDKQVGTGEMVAMDDNGGYVQLSVIVNPNNEAESDILTRFADDEKIELRGKEMEADIAGMTFETMTGVKEKDRYMVAVSTDSPDYVVALKVKYADSDEKDLLLGGFDELVPSEDETETEAVEEYMVPAEVSDTEADEEAATEADTEESMSIQLR